MPTASTEAGLKSRRFAELTPAEQIRAVEILRPAFERALARYRERKRLEALGLERAA
jgi:hypothetical protein